MTLRQKGRQKALRLLLWLGLPSLLAIPIVLVLLLRHVPTLVDVALKVDRVSFILGGNVRFPVLNGVRFSSMTVERFDSFRFTPAKIEIGLPSADSRFFTWKTAALSGTRVVVKGKDPRVQPAVTLESADQRRGRGRIDRMWADPGARVTFETGEKGRLTVRIAGRRSELSALFPDPFRLIADYCEAGGVHNLSAAEESIVLRGLLRADMPAVEITGSEDALVASLTVASDGEVQFPVQGIPVTALDFSSRDVATGDRTSSLRDSGLITYPNQPALPASPVLPTDQVVLDQLHDFRLYVLLLDPERGVIGLRASGRANHLTSGSGRAAEDRRLTLLTSLSLDRRLAVGLGAIVWVFSTTLGAFRLYREMKQ